MTIPIIRTPGLFVEFDPTRAFVGPSILQYSAIIIGQRLAGGTRPALQLNRVTSYDLAIKYYGEGSNLSRMVKAWIENNKTTKLYCIALDDDGAGVAATGSYVIGGTATAAGSIPVYIGGDRISIAVNVGDTASVLGDRLAAAIPVTTPASGVNVAGTVTFTALNKGENGDDIYLDAFYGANEELPEGLTFAINQMSGGANNPDVQTVIDLLGDEWYNIWVAPYYDDTNLDAIESELADRFGALRQIDGVYFTSIRGNVGVLSSFGDSRNSPHVCIPHSEKVLTSSFEVGAAFAAQVAKEGSIDPARPFTSLQLVGILPPRELERFTQAENNSLLFDGISTFKATNTGEVLIQQAITMYQKNALGIDDIAYYKVNTMLTLMFMRFDFRSQIGTRYPRAKLADDGIQVGPNQQIMTPSLGKTEAINIFKGWELLGIAENITQFKRDLICQRSIVDPNRLEWILPPDLVNQFDVGAATLQFLLQQPIL